MRAADTDSAAYAAEVARLLWPAPWPEPVLARAGRGAGPGRDAYLFPSARRPRLLVPVDVPSSSCMLERLGGNGPAVQRPVRRLLQHSVRSRAFPLTRWPVLRVPGTPDSADSIERHLSRCLDAEVRVGVLLGTRRVNQKPVLTVFDRTGAVRGYAKVGHNPLTRALVRREATALAALGDGPVSLRVPRVIHHGSWSGLEVLVLSPLVTDPRAEVTRPVLTEALRELTALPGLATGSLGASSYWARLSARVTSLSGRPEGGRLRACLDDLEASHDAAVVTLGGWHGDWGRWNMGMADGVLRVWDWERYDSDVPVGFDALHFDAQSVRPGQRDAGRQEATFLRSVPQALLDLDVPVERHEVTLRLYLLEIATRYVDALAHGSTPALRRRTAWVLSLLERSASRPLTSSPEGRP